MKTSPHPFTYLQSKYGVSRNKLFALLLNHWILPTEVRSSLSNYCLYHYKGDCFIAKLYDGCIPIFGKSYAVIYQNCNSLQVKSAEEIEVSYREANTDFNLQPIAIVRITKS